MGERIDPREVLTYLNELGYTNISAQQLKEFIKDLKKIIKFDFRTQQRASDSTESEYSHHSVDEPANYSSNKENLPRPANKENEPPKKTLKEKHIAVHIYDRKSKRCVDHEHCVHTCVTQPVNKTHTTQTVTQIITQSDITSKPEITTESTVQPTAPPSSRVNSRISRTGSKDRRSKVAFIRQAVSKPLINKTDPVALYHFYQEEWKKSKIPGEESRDDLRWAIRERMLSGPKVEVRSRCSSTTPRSVFFRC